MMLLPYNCHTFGLIMPKSTSVLGLFTIMKGECLVFVNVCGSIESNEWRTAATKNEPTPGKCRVEWSHPLHANSIKKAQHVRDPIRASFG